MEVDWLLEALVDPEDQLPRVVLRVLVDRDLTALRVSDVAQVAELDIFSPETFDEVLGEDAAIFRFPGDLVGATTRLDSDISSVELGMLKPLDPFPGVACVDYEKQAPPVRAGPPVPDLEQLFQGEFRLSLLYPPRLFSPLRKYVEGTGGVLLFQVEL